MAVVPSLVLTLTSIMYGCSDLKENFPIRKKVPRNYRYLPWVRFQTMDTYPGYVLRLWIPTRMSQYRQSPTKSRFSEYFGHMYTSLPMVGQKSLAVLGEVQISAYVLSYGGENAPA